MIVRLTPSTPHRLPLRRSARNVRAPERYSSVFALAVEEGKPQSYDEAVAGQLKDKWLEAMREEMDSLEQNATYELVELPIGRRALNNKWVFKLKQ